jgi:hypothetical protein
MPYSAEITRRHPAYFIFTVDRSASMNDEHASNSGKSKAESVADAINRIIANVVIRCSKNEGVYDYFSISVIGYGAQVGSAFSGPLAGRPIASASELDANPARLEARKQRVRDRNGKMVDIDVKFPIWFDAVAEGATPMNRAFGSAYGLAYRWAEDHPTGYPPIVMNLTDGESTDGDPQEAARRITSIKTNDGNALLFNMHISSGTGEAVLYPPAPDELPDSFARGLFAISSVLPEAMLHQASALELPVAPGSRGFVFNGDVTSAIQFLEIGTKPANMAIR